MAVSAPAKDKKAPVLPPENEARAAIARLSKRDFLEQYQQLSRQFTADPGNPGSYASTGCERCANCMFCKDCESCTGCTHCVDCALCNNCSHCVEGKNLFACAYCVRSENCSGSAYLTLSQNCSDCTYCFGSVGLAKKDFYILNAVFPRTEYFEIVARLKKEMGL